MLESLPSLLPVAAEVASEVATEAAPEENIPGGQQFLVAPLIGLMIWTLAIFGFTMLVLQFSFFPKLRRFLAERAEMIDGSYEAAKRDREDAEVIREDYRQKLMKARADADEIVVAARQEAEHHRVRIEEASRRRGEEIVSEARRQVQHEVREAMKRIEREVADMSLVAAERVTGKELGDEKARRLIDEALAGVDFDALVPVWEV